MKKISMPLLLGCFIVTGTSFAQNPPPAPPPPAAPATVKPYHRHPEITKAMHDLRLAKNHLANAAHDYGGHRVKAIADIDAALAELHEALNY